MAHGIVERLEIVQVDQQQSALMVTARGGAQRMFQPVLQQAPIRQFGQWIVERQAPDFLLGGFAFGDVARHHHEAWFVATVHYLARHR